MPQRALGDIGAAHAALATAAALATPEGTQREFAALFGGEADGQVWPYASHYRGAARDDAALIALRAALARLGIERAEGIDEPEDHLAIVCETYAGLLAGAFASPAGEAERFFAHHLGPWAARCFGDIETAKAAVFYRAVGQLGRAAVGSVAAPA